MGLFDQIIRSIKRSLKNLFKGKNSKKKSRKQWREEVDEVPSSWKKSTTDSSQISKTTIKHKKRLPGLLLFKRILAGVLLGINFIFSQFLLGAVGEGAQPMFVIFLLNSFILLDYIWKTRRKE